MKKNPIYSEATMIAMLCVPFAYLLFIWNKLPASIPGHYGPGGRPDRYDSKELLLAVLAGCSVLMYALRYLPHFDPKGNLFGSTFVKIRLLIVLFWSAFMCWFWYISLHGTTPDSMTGTLFIGVNLLLAGMGNLMYALKPSFFVGIRTPWTLSSDVVWRKTHHLAGLLWVVGGLLGAVLTWWLPTNLKMPVSLGLITVLGLVPVGYSYWVYRQLAATPTNKTNLN